MNYIIYLFIITMLTALDQYSKFIVSSYMKLGESIEMIPRFFYLTYALNDGAGFSIMRGQRSFFIAITVAALVIFCVLLYKNDRKNLFSTASYLLIIAGTIGNFIDRLGSGLVTDFLDFYIFGYDFPIFNVADTYLTLGVILLVLITLKEEKGWH